MIDEVGLEATSVPDSWYSKSGLIFVDICPHYLRLRQRQSYRISTVRASDNAS